MKLNRTKNAKRNIFFGLINKVVSLILPFLMRTITIKILGVEYLGLSSLFASILSVLNLTELGFSGAIVFNMYEPIAKNDDKTLCALLNFYKNVYRVVGIIILIIGIVLLPYLPKLISGEYPEGINIYFIYIIYLINTSISYFMFAYYKSLLLAFQRSDILSNINSVLSLFTYVVQIIILVLFRNYYLYLLLLPLSTMIDNIISAFFCRKKFPNYYCTGKLDSKIKKDIKKRVSGTAITKIQAITRNSFDSIFISAFLGLKLTAIYSNYYYIMMFVVGFMYIIVNSITAGVGYSVASETKEKNYIDMNKMNFIYMWISGWCFVCLLCLYQPFMRIWLGNEMMLDFPAMLLFCIYFYCLKIGDIRSVYLDANGLWWENRYKAVFESIANFGLNFILGKFFGIYGILFATIITILIINYGYGSRIVFQHYFGIEYLKDYFKKNNKYALITSIVSCMTYMLCWIIPENGILFFSLKCIVCVLLPNLFYILFYFHDEYFCIAVPWIFRILGIDRFNIVASFLKNIEQSGGHYSQKKK